MSEEEESAWIRCFLLNDIDATPCPEPRMQLRSIGVDSLFDRSDTLAVLSSADGSDTEEFPDTPDSSQATSEPRILPPTPSSVTTTPPVTAPPMFPPPIQTTPRTVAPRTAGPLPALTRRPSAPSPSRDTAPRATAPVIRPSSAPVMATLPLYDIDFLAELDFQRRQEEQATVRLAEEYDQASQERLRTMVRVYEDEMAGSRASAAEDDSSDNLVHDSPPQTLYCNARAQHLAKRRSKQKAQHQYPVKRGGDPSDALVVVRYPDTDAMFTVRRFGLQEMDARHGEVSKFRRAWLDDYHADQRGYHGDRDPVHGIRLYCTDVIYRAQLPDLYEELYYVDLFFRNKFYSAFGKRQPAVAPPQHYHAWCNFVKAYIDANSREANAYEKSLRSREDRFYSKSALGVAMKIHSLSMKKEIPCTVPVKAECPSCYPEASREAIGSTSPQDLVKLHSHLHELLNKQKQIMKPVVSEFSDRVMVERLEAEVSKLKADAECQRQQIDSLANESKERAAEYGMLQERNASLQANIAVEVATQLSRHFRALSGSILSATPPH